jgi:phosphate starvation-inducible protein PhoH
MPPNINPFYLPRKANLVVPKSKYKPVRYITNIELIGNKECQCILVDNKSHLYLTNNFIVTHNTFCAIMAALQLLSDKKVSDLIYLRSIVESSDHGIGYLKGDLETKISVYLAPLMDKLEELLPKNEIDFLIKDQRVIGQPINFLRGINWNAKVIVADECQNMNFKELVTLISRVGNFSKLYILFDDAQSDIKNSGIMKLMEIFNDEESRNNGIFTFEFTDDDIVRSELVKFIIKKLKIIKN